jgi:hypothetical protein
MALTAGGEPELTQAINEADTAKTNSFFIGDCDSLANNRV